LKEEKTLADSRARIIFADRNLGNLFNSYLIFKL
jgi:hypothetical protein